MINLKPSVSQRSMSYRHVFITDIFEVKLTSDMLTVHGQQHSFSTHERMFLWKCQSFWDRKSLDLRGTRTPNLGIHAECSNHLSYQGQTFAVRVVVYISRNLDDSLTFFINDSYHFLFKTGVYARVLLELSHTNVAVISWISFVFELRWNNRSWNGGQLSAGKTGSRKQFYELGPQQYES